MDVRREREETHYLLPSSTSSVQRTALLFSEELAHVDGQIKCSMLFQLQQHCLSLLFLLHSKSISSTEPLPLTVRHLFVLMLFGASAQLLIHNHWAMLNATENWDRALVSWTELLMPLMMITIEKYSLRCLCWGWPEKNQTSTSTTVPTFSTIIISIIVISECYSWLMIIHFCEWLTHSVFLGCLADVGLFLCEVLPKDSYSQHHSLLRWRLLALLSRA